MPGYKVPDWRRSLGEHMFDVEVEGHVFTLPTSEYLAVETVELLGKIGELGITEVLNRVAPALTRTEEDKEGVEYEVEVRPGLGTAFAPVPQKYVLEFLSAWQKDEAAVDMGESDASAGS